MYLSNIIAYFDSCPRHLIVDVEHVLLGRDRDYGCDHARDHDYVSAAYYFLAYCASKSK